MNYDYISNCLDMCDEHLDEGGYKVTSVLLRGFNLPQDINKLFMDDHKLVRKIVNFYYNDFVHKSNKYNTLQEAMDNISFIINKNNDKKSKVIKFSDQIISWLLETEFFNNIYENHCPNIIDPTEIQPITKIENDIFIPRENQLEAFQKLEKDGLETGIHCQATGCGKSYIILKYIDYVLRTTKKPNPKVILFTERVNILSDLFSFKKGKLESDMEKLKYWKSLGVGDLTKYHIINRVTNKDPSWNEELKKSTKPTLLVINRAFLTLGKKYNIFGPSDIDLILHDECHNTSSVQCHEFLKKSKELGVKIVGFSATPLRTGKYDKTKLLEIYGKSDELNLLTNYNMIYAISKNLILPPEFYWYQIESYSGKNENCLVTQEELGSVFEMLNFIVPTLPNKKLVAWCGTIMMAKYWKSEIEKTYRQRANLKYFKFGLDTSEEATEDYNYFSKVPKDTKGKILKLEELEINDPRRMYYGNSILFCANKHREGSDITLLDACIFLDKVKNRGPIPFIQSIGRALRWCPFTSSKTKGVIIDGFIKDGNGYEKQFVDKIIGYYMALENITGLDEESENKYEQYIKMMDVVKFDKEQQVINMRLGGKNISIHCNKLEWESIVSKFDSILQGRIKISEDEVFQVHIEKLKMLDQFQNPENNFWKEYRKLNHNELQLPEDIYEPYKHIWETKTWYDLLGFKFHNYNEFKNYLQSNNIKSNKDLHKHLKKYKCNNFPYYPDEYYRLSGWTNWNNIINDETIFL